MQPALRINRPRSVFVQGKVLPAMVLALCLSGAVGASGNLTSLKADAVNGSGVAQFDLGNRYLNGEGVEQDNFEALRWFTLAAESGNANAQYNIAVMYLNGIGVVRDSEQAVAWFLRAAENGDPPAQFTLGILLFNGQLGVPENIPEAYKWFILAGTAGHQSAAANAVLVQELLSAADVLAKQDEARAWIEEFEQKRKIPSLE
jgi:uncharacterized protein